MKAGIDLKRLLLLGTALTVAVASCGKEDKKSGGGGNQEEGGSRTLVLTPFEDLNQGDAALNSHAGEETRSTLKMDWRSYQELGAADNVVLPTYSRIRTLADGTYIMGWHNTMAENNANGSDTYYALSKDFKTWTYMGYLWQSYPVTNLLGKADTRLFTNPNFFQLSNGEVLAVAAFRTKSTYGNQACTAEQGIIIKRSSDGGRTWFGEKEIYHGPCWEAHVIELPSGQIQCFFSESRPWISSSHSGTTMVWSDDGGATWSPALGQAGWRVMRKTWWNQKPQNGGAMYCFTYQMPVGVILNGTKQFAFAMESCNQRVINANGSTNDQFSVAVCFSRPDGEWVNLAGDEILPKEQRIDSVVARGAAPYLVQFRSGETVLAYGGTDAKQHLRIGNATATEFGDDLAALPHKGSWGALDVSRSHTVLSCMRDSDAGYNDAKIAIAKFYLDHSITATSRTVTVDGNNTEWAATDEALFVGAKCQAQATLRCAADQDNYYFLVEVLDQTLSTSDFAYILLAPGDSDGRLGGKARRVRLGVAGLKSTDQYAGGWKEYDFGARAVSAYDGTLGDNTDTDHGWLAEVAVPRSAVEAADGRLLVDFGYFDAADNVEDVVADANTLSKWIIVKGL